MTIEQSMIERFSNQKPQQQPPVLNADKDVALSPTSGVIDLTSDANDKEDDLKKAIELSLKEQVLGGQVSMEDQDLSRVIEASLAESKAVGTKRKRGEAWQDPLNPHDRKRNGHWPVGLKNVGNTCWFSAVIQSLFHLPIFRQLVLSYMPPREWSNVTSEKKTGYFLRSKNAKNSSRSGSVGKEKRNLLFMQELRKLFALMLCSKRKYVDPSQALEELKEAFPESSGTDSQQDVSEFSHKLLEWLEEAFKLSSSLLPVNTDVMMDDSEDLHKNPMLDLFYGHFRSEGHNEGRTFSNEETFGQYPLQVNSFNDIHESLEAAMTQEIETSDVMTKSGQESWFTRLPPVLIFELSRFQFNQQMGRPEKIHNKLEFPEIMYMDRYMEQNKNMTRSIRERVRSLKDERDKLQRHLEKYLNYGSGPKKVPLQDLLQYTLEFVEKKKVDDPSSLANEDVEMSSPGSNSSDSPNSPNKINAMEMANSALNNFPMNNCFSMNRPNQDHVNLDDEIVPMPQHISDVELKVLQTCLRRWRSEVESSVKELQGKINEIHYNIKEIYNEPALKKKPYRLHAVLVHEGQAASGHYWAYVYLPRQNLWLKFNDITVTEATWSELHKDSMGGQHYASAYCLVYVDNERTELFDEDQEFQIVGPDFLYGLPDDLQQYVEGDNSNFEVELQQWDMEQSRKKDSSTSTSCVFVDEYQECTIIAEKRVFDESAVNFYNTSSMEHALLLHKSTMNKIDQLTKMIMNQGPNEALNEIIRQESLRLRRLARLPGTAYEDPRLAHIGVYILINTTNAEPFLTWSILEQFLIPELDDSTNGHLIKETAIQKLATFKHRLSEEHFNAYDKWHQDYEKFRKAVCCLIHGIESYHKENYTVGLNALLDASELNKALVSKGVKRGLEVVLLYHYRRKAALKLNEAVAHQFEVQDIKGALDALTVAYEHILPCMEYLISPTAPQARDVETAELIRNRWCSILGVDLTSPKQEKLQDFLSKLLDSTNEMPKPRSPNYARILNLEDVYRSVLSRTHIKNEYDEAMQAK